MSSCFGQRLIAIMVCPTVLWSTNMLLIRDKQSELIGIGCNNRTASLAGRT
jgi:hypothetical protein